MGDSATEEQLKDAPAKGETCHANDEKSNDCDIMDEKEKIKKEATLLFLQGKRSIYIRDFQAAAVTLSQSCQLFSQIYSEQDEAMADPFFYYGKALLEVGRNESEVLGDQVQDDDKGEDDEEDDEEDENQGESEVNVEEVAQRNDATNQNGTTSEETENVEQKTENESDEINDLQLSWDFLELAKLIYSKKADTCKETAIKLAETYLCLGENGLESENYSIAIEDIKQALELQKKHLPEFDRRIAETYYKLGMAFSLAQNYDEAISNFKMAIEQLKRKISSLEMRKKMGDKKTEEEEKDAFYTMDGEINEIEVVIKDVEEKIKDMLDCKNQVKTELLKQVVSGGNEAGAASSSSSNDTTSQSSTIPATDISHLIKKKRKNDDEDTSSGKKTKTEN